MFILDYEKMLKFVKETLEANDAIRPKKPNQGFRDRYEHTERVFKWCQILMKDYVLINEEVCLTAAIFHDVGYAYGQDNHPHNGVLLFQDYALKNNFDTEFIKRVSDIIEVHSDKTLLKNDKSKPELIIVLEADLMDEEGALGILWDLMSEGLKNPKSYIDGLNTLYEHSAHILNQDYMVTPIARKEWNHKKEFVKNFIEELKIDLFMEDK